MKKSSLLALCGLLLLTAVFTSTPPIAHAATFNVNSTVDAVDSNIGDAICRTAANSCTLRAAIQEANSTTAADVINLPAGTYTLSIDNEFEENGGAEGDLDITNDLTISGSGRTNTFLDGGEIDRILHVLGSGTTLTLTDVNLQGGAADGRVVNVVWGGALFNDGGTVTIDNVTFENNEADRGGAIASQGMLTIEDSLINNNQAVDFGGGIYSHEGTAVLTRMTISNNQTTDDDGGGFRALNTNVTINDSSFTGNSSGSRGGGFSTQTRGTNNVTATIDNSTFSGNTAAETGGGIFSWRPLTLSNSIIEQNEATEGGGIYGDENLDMSDTIIRENVASGNGGGLNIRRGVPTFDSIQIIDNEAGGSGGGLYLEQAITLTNGAIVGNQAGENGGGVWTSIAGTFSNVTIGNNDAGGSGGGVYLQGGPTEQTFSLLYTSVGHNTGQPAGGIHVEDGIEPAFVQLGSSAVGDNSGQQCIGHITSSGYSVISDNSCQISGTGDRQNSPPRFEMPADNGGDTLTMALLPLSAAVEAGNPNDCPATDQRGVARPINIGGGPSRCDSGAFEYSGPTNFVGISSEVAASEGDFNRQETVTIAVWFPQSSSFSVSYATVNGTATAGQDFASRSGTLNFAAGETSKTVNITIFGDLEREGLEQFFVQLSNGQGTTISQASTTITLLEDDVKVWIPFVVK